MMLEINGRSFWFCLGSLALLGGVAVYWMTASFGLGLDAGSVAYLQTARHFLLGDGIACFDPAARLMPESRYPPIFPVVLSAAWFLGLSFIEWARSLNSFLFAGTIFLAGAVVLSIKRSPSIALGSALLLLLSVQLLKAHGILGAAPLFLFILLGWTRLMLLFVDSGSRRALYAAAVCAGVAALTIYWGMVVALAGVCWLVVRGRSRDAALFLTAALIFPAMWFVRNVALTGTLAGVCPDGGGSILQVCLSALDHVSGWLLPLRVPLWLRLGVSAAVLILFVKWWKSPSVSCAKCRKFLIVAVIAFFGLSLARSAHLVGMFHQKGYGYSSRAVSTSKLAETLRSIDDRVPLYSNDPAAVFYFSGRPSVRIPDGVGTVQQVKDDFTQRRAVAVIFSRPVPVLGLEWDRLALTLGMEPLFKDPVGNIFGVRKK